MAIGVCIYPLGWDSPVIRAVCGAAASRCVFVRIAHTQEKRYARPNKKCLNDLFNIFTIFA